MPVNLISGWIDPSWWNIHCVGVSRAHHYAVPKRGATYLNSVLVVGRREDLLDNKLPRACHDARIIPEVSVLEEDAGVLFMDAYGVLDGADLARPRRELGVQVVD